MIPIVISFSLMTLHSNKVFDKRIAEEISYKGISEFEKQDNINIEKKSPSEILVILVLAELMIGRKFCINSEKIITFLDMALKQIDF